jgi:hypothetical protein
MPLKNFQTVSSYFTVEKTDLHAATERKRGGGGLCSKIRTVDTGVVHCKDEIKKKRVCSLGRISFTWRNLTQNAALKFPGKQRLEKI